MRTRLLVIVLVLVGLLAAGLGVPLALSTSQARQSQLFTQQLTDTIFYASLAERPITQADTSGLAAELQRYDEVYGVAVLVLDREGRLIASVAAGRRPRSTRRGTSGWRWRWPTGVRTSTRCAGRGTTGRSSSPSPCWWTPRCAGRRSPSRRPMTCAPSRCRCGSSCWRRACSRSRSPCVVALPIVRWILRPVRRLDEGTGRVASAVLAGGAPDPVADGSGPAGAAAALRVVRPDGRDGRAGLRRPARLRRGRQPPAAQPAHRAAAAAVQPRRARRRPWRRRTRWPRWRRPSGSSTLLDGLLALARAERTAPLVPVDVDAGVDDRIEAWRPLAEHSGLRCAATGPHGHARHRDGRGHRDAAGRGARQRREVHAVRRVGHGHRGAPSPRSSRSPCGTPARGCHPTSWSGPPTGSGAAPGTAASTGRGWGSRSPPAPSSWRAASCSSRYRAAAACASRPGCPPARNGMRTSR